MSRVSEEASNLKSLEKYPKLIKAIINIAKIDFGFLSIEF
jgi:hypothetical protein